MRPSGKALALCAAIAAASGCGGSSQSVAPAPAPTATGVFTSVMNASRGTLLASLGDLKAIRYYAQFLRRSQFPPATPNPAPSCDPTSHIATSVSTDFTKKNDTIAVAYYPAGDVRCSSSPYAVLEMYYPNVGGARPQAGFGYEVTFAPSGGQVAEYDVVHTAVYGVSPLNVDTQVDRFDPASVPPGFVQPAPGRFPATFPLDFSLPNPLPQTLQPESFDSDYYASVGGGAGASQTGTAATVVTNPDFFQTNTGGKTQFIGLLDQASVAVSGPDAAGNFTYRATHRAPAYAFDLLGRIEIANGTFELGPNQTAWSLAPIPSGYVAQNFAPALVDTATYSGGGMVIAAHQAYTDAVNQVSVDATYAAASHGYLVTVTDLLRKAAATSPSPILLDATGASVAPYTYVFDGSPGSILDFTVVQ